MLLYLGTGPRRYGEEPVAWHRRRGWEFQAVLKGSIALSEPNGMQVARKQQLWVFPPEHHHGWGGIKRQTAEVAVFHFLTVPEQLRRMVTPGNHLEIPLSATQVTRLRQLARNAERYWNHPSPGMTLCYEHILLELSLLVCESRAQRERPAQETSAERRVDAAVQWFSLHMEENPGLPEVARASSTSPAHLRRLFHEVLDTSPKQIFDQLRFQRAMQLMSDPESKLEAISERCGFGSASAFSRAFKDKFGCSPEAWRRVPIQPKSRIKPVSRAAAPSPAKFQPRPAT